MKSSFDDFKHAPWISSTLKKKTRVLSHVGCTFQKQKQEQKTHVDFHSIHDDFYFLYSAVLLHAVAVSGDETVTGTQRTCSNYTCFNYYSKACCLRDKGVSFKTTHRKCTEKNLLLLKLCCRFKTDCYVNSRLAQ